VNVSVRVSKAHNEVARGEKNINFAEIQNSAIGISRFGEKAGSCGEALWDTAIDCSDNSEGK